MEYYLTKKRNKKHQKEKLSYFIMSGEDARVPGLKLSIFSESQHCIFIWEPKSQTKFFPVAS